MRCNSCLLLLASACMLAANAAQAEPVCSSGTCARGLSMLQMPRKPPVRIDGKWLVVNNKRYSRMGAHKAWLGRIGRTTGIWVRPAQINFRRSAPDAWLEGNVKVLTDLALSSSQYSDIAASLKADAPNMGLSASAGINSSSAHSATYVLRGMTFENTWRIKHWFNAAAERDEDSQLKDDFMDMYISEDSDEDSQLKEDFMDMYGIAEKPRIVTTVWVLVSGDDEHAKQCTGGHLSLKYGSAELTISGEGCSESTWSFSPDTIIAYEASYIRWANMVSSPPRGRAKDVVADWYWTR